MRICRFNGGKIGVVVNNHVFDVTSLITDLQTQHWPCAPGDPLIAALPSLRPKFEEVIGECDSMPLSDCELLSPVATPSKIIGAPVNYHLHRDEANVDAQINNGTKIETIETYGLFLKANTSLIGPSQAIVLPDGNRRIDHEIELVVVIGNECKNVSRIEALDVIAGYAIGNDVTIRGPEDRSLRKSVDTFTVVGPWLVTADEIGNPRDLHMILSVNGQMKQQANTRDLICDVQQLIVYASAHYTLYPGDLIFTGTPAGVGPIQRGDVIHQQIEGIGEFISNVV
jgi:2-keto-4-pentenoate hydratase/2-oxohepta-3-ene-1,7-dioic acid hydratase in catechol pathway